MQNLKIGSLNISGGRVRQERALISEVATQKKVLFLLETHSNPADEANWGLWWQGPCCLSHGTHFSAEVFILLRPCVTILSSDKVVKGLLLIVRTKIEGLVFGTNLSVSSATC